MSYSPQAFCTHRILHPSNGTNGSSTTAMEPLGRPDPVEVLALTQELSLLFDLARQPFVVVITKGHQVAGSGPIPDFVLLQVRLGVDS